MTDLRSHDENLIATLKAATFSEQKTGSGVIIKLAHLKGEVSFCDGYMTWSVSASEAGGRKAVDQKDIDASAEYLLNYGRKAVKNALSKLADEVIESATKRLAQ